MINIFQPSLSGNELKNIKKVFSSNWLGRGNAVQEFESEFSKTLKSSVEKFYAITSCTDGLFLAADIFDFKQDDEVIVPTISFIAVGSAVFKSGATLVLCDVDKRSLNATAETISSKITPQTKAIILNHYGGHPCDMDGIMKLANENNIIVIEDSACAVQSFYKGKACGTIGDMGIWSFDAMKSLVTGDGGMLYMKTKENMEIAKEYSYLGLPAKSTSGIDKFKSGSDIWWEVQIKKPGRRSQMNNIIASIGLAQLQRLPSFLTRRKEIYNKYEEAFIDNINIQFPPNLLDGCKNSYYFFWIQLEHSQRNNLANYLKNNEVYTTFRYWPLSRVDYFDFNKKDYPNTEIATDTTLNLPLHQNLSNQDVEKVITLVNDFFK